MESILFVDNMSDLDIDRKERDTNHRHEHCDCHHTFHIKPPSKSRAWHRYT
jgi:hypothetical protein